jgi:hypothetical protein
MYLFKLRQILRNETTENGDEGGAPALQPHTQLTGRAAAMEQLSASYEERLAPDLADFDEETGTSTPRAAPPAPEPEAEPDDAVITAPEEPQTESEPSRPRMVPIVVDGQTIEVDETRIIEAGKRTLQKESAADRRLQEANEILARAKAQAQRASQDPNAQPTQQAPSQDAPQQPTQQATNGLDDPAALFSAIRQTVTHDVIETIKSQQAVSTFRTEFPEIASDPNLWQIAIRLENERLRDAAALGEAPGDALVAYRKHGAEIRAWKATFAPQAPAAEVPVDRQERKRNITAIPAVNANTPAPQTPKLLTASEQIEQMRVERKQYGRPLTNRSVQR